MIDNADIHEMFRTVLILPNQARVIQLKLKRRISERGYYIYETLMPYFCCGAVWD